MRLPSIFFFFFFNDTATTEIYTLSLHYALPISRHRFRIEHAQHIRPEDFARFARLGVIASMQPYHAIDDRSEEHTSELQSRSDLVCRLLLEKKKTQQYTYLNLTLLNTGPVVPPS